MFGTLPEEYIKDGTATDAYFLRTEDALDHVGANPEVVADVSADQFPEGEYELLAGVNQAAELLAEVDADLDVWTLPEGTLFNGGPVMRIKGNYRDFARYETSLLGILSHASGIATKALETTTAADQFEDPPQVLSFGARHVHPSLTPVVERSALVGGVDGFSHVGAGKVIDREPGGTMPHALVIALGSQEAAWNAFNESAGEDTPRILLCDTFTDERDEVLRALEELDGDLEGVRLDTTGSRRGDFEHIIKEAQWAANYTGYEDPEMFVSGGLGPRDIQELGDVVDGFGIGGYISNADPVDFSLDIVEKEGEPVTKRGKLEGVKRVFRGDGHSIEPATECGAGMFEPLLQNGEVVEEYDIEEAQARVLRESKMLEFRK